ncbi:MAG: thioredoxin family protein [Bacteroidales bacterium]|nr:thioredoxin family protein [Bacteroidales bacterium]
MKYINKFFLLSLIIVCATFTLAYSQDSPAKWTFSTKALNDSVAELQLQCALPSGWHIYSQYTKGTELPIEFNFTSSKDYSRIGSVKEPSYKAHYDKFAKDSTRYFEGNVLFKQRIKINTDKDFKVKGSLTFQLCENGSCIPPDDVEFVFNVKGNPLLVSLSEQAKDSLLSVSSMTELVQEKSDDAQSSQQAVVSETEKSEYEGKSMWSVFFFSLGAGLLALITPCVFPMIPMTVSFFLKGNKDKRKGRIQAYFFGLSIIFIFVVLGLLLTLLISDDAMYLISTHWLPNIIFFVIFIIFALSFFGLFEITMPGKLVDKSDKQSNKGGFLGSFFIALTTVLVSFSCTGPILGGALVELASGSGNRMVFLVAMFGFALGFALPFTLLAMFPSVLKNMKSGSWLNSVKIVFGFLELALGLKFLSMADLSANWGLLSRTTYLCIWIVLFILLGFYLLGKLKFKGDSDLKHITVFRLLFAVCSFSFAVYLLPGLWGAPLKTVSGYLPPMTTQEFNIEKIILENRSSAYVSPSEGVDFPKNRKYADKLDSHVPVGFKAFFDLEEAKAFAKQVGKPLFLDFTGKSCANCREMESSVWTDAQVKKMITEDYILVSLYADEYSIELPESEWIEANGKTVKNLGRKNQHYEITEFHANAQPLYVLMDSEGNLLCDKPMPYNKKTEDFRKFLSQGIERYKSGK